MHGDVSYLNVKKVEQDMTSLNTIFIVFWPIPITKLSYGNYRELLL